MNDRLRVSAVSAFSLRQLITNWSQAERLYTLEAEGQIGELLVESFTAEDELSKPFTIRLVVLSLDTDIAFTALRLKHVTLKITLADGSRVSRSAIIIGVHRLVSDGGFQRLELILQPWVALLAYSTHSRAWQNKTLVQILDDVLAPYKVMGDWQWGEKGDNSVEDIEDFLAQGPNAGVHSYCVQYRETDLAFAQRMLANAGLNWRIQEDESAPTGHRLVIFADSWRVPENITSGSALGGKGIRFHAAGAQEVQDAIQALGGVRTLRSGMTSQLSWDYNSKQAISAQIPTNHRFASDNLLTQAPWLETYEYHGQEADTGAAGVSQRQHAATLVQEAVEARNKIWLGRSTVRSLCAGERFVLTQSVLDALESFGKKAADREFVVVKVLSLGINNMPRELSEAIGAKWTRATGDNPFETHPYPALDTLAHDPELAEQAQASGFANRFEAIRRAVPWRPLPQSAPTAGGPQTAIVVGPSGNTTPEGADEIYTDRLGRIRVRFHWQSGLAADPRADNQSSCWVRVSQSWAGPGMGHQFVPRIGMEVSVVFLNGDICRPLVTGCLYNGRGEAGLARTPGGQPGSTERVALSYSSDHQPSAQGNLVNSGSGGNAPAWHGGAAGVARTDANAQNNSAALSGVKSKEFGGQGFSQLVFDDTPQQLRTQLATTQYATQLNLGHLIHQTDNHRGSYRGRGFELRTNAYGAIRAGQGVLISSYLLGETDPAGDNAPGMALITQALMLSDIFNLAAQQHQTTRLASSIGTLKSNQSVLSDKEAPLKALQTALRGMVGSTIGQAQSDAANKNTRTSGDRVPHTTDPVVAISARAGLGMAAGQSIELASGEVISVQSGQDTNIAVGGQMRVHTGQSLGVLAGAVQAGSGAKGTGLTMINGLGPIDVQAQAGQMQMAAKGLINIQSAHAEIDWAAAKRIVLATTAGASLTIDETGITSLCPGKITIKAGKKSFVGPGVASYVMPSFNKNDMYSASYVVTDKNTGKPMPFVPYVLKSASGEEISGLTDEHGRTVCMFTPKEEDVRLNGLEHKPKAVQKLFAAGAGQSELVLDYKDTAGQA